MRANLLVELSGLQRSEQLMVKMAAKKEAVDEYARVLTQHHAQVCVREGLLTEPPAPAHQQYPKSWPNSPETSQGKGKGKYPYKGWYGNNKA